MVSAKSCNKKISQIDFSNTDKDTLFVLGRNIYQTACGGSGYAESWIENLEISLDSIGGSAAIHILNGILFEIYFNSNAQIRKTLKAEYYEIPVKLCIKDRYAVCGVFIRDFLEQYPQRIIYIPGSGNILTTDILISEEDDQYHIDGICIDGLSCMYDEDATEFYEYNGSSYYYKEVTLSELENIILEKVAIPKNKIKFTCNVNISPQTSILIPSNFNLLRYV